MNDTYKAPAPCDSLREPFFSRGYCNACHWLAQLHTAEGWREYHLQRAGACRDQVAGLTRRLAELNDAVSQAEAEAEAVPTWTPFAETGYISVHEPRQFPNTNTETTADV